MRDQSGKCTQKDLSALVCVRLQELMSWKPIVII